MTTFERIKSLAKAQGKSLNMVEDELGYGRNVLYRLKSTNPSSERLQEIADYFHVSTDYLLGRETSTDKKENEFAQFFKMTTDGLSEEQADILKEEWLDYLDIRAERMKKRNAERNHKK